MPTKVATCGDHGGRKADGEPCGRETDGRCWQHPEKSGGKSEPKLIPQPHGGALLSGGVPGNAGGGRPPSAVKQALRLDFDQRREILNKIAEGETVIRLVGKCSECGHVGEAPDWEEIKSWLESAPSANERIRALEVMAKYSDLQGDGVDEGLIAELGQVVSEVVEDRAVLELVWDGWKKIIGRRIVLGS